MLHAISSFRSKEFSGIAEKLQFIAATISQSVRRLDDGKEISCLPKKKTSRPAL